MRAQIYKTWDRVHSSFWFLPAVMAGGAIALAFLTVALDPPVTNWVRQNWGWTFTGGAEGTSAVLGCIAASMITLAGVVFSMTLVTLSLASTQLGPRLLRNFMRDTTTQAVLGTFIATFLYCLLVLRTIRRANEVVFVPHLSASLGVLLAVVSVGVLIYFIHHVSVSIQANEIVAVVGTELIEGIERMFPANIAQGTEHGAEQAASRMPTEPPDAALPEVFAQEASPLGATGDGYIQFIDTAALTALAAQEDVLLRLEQGPGHYVVAGCPLVRIWPANRLSDQFVNRVNAAFVLGNQRTSGQDIEFMVNQLVEIAVRALSPGINDPFTAMMCVDHLGSALCRLVQRDMPSPLHHDAQDQLRVVMPVITFSDITDAAFNQIRQYGRSCAAVTIRLLETIAVIAEFAHRSEDCATLLRHAEMIVRGARGGLSEDEDRREAEKRYQTAKRLLNRTTDSDSDICGL